MTVDPDLLRLYFRIDTTVDSADSPPSSEIVYTKIIEEGN